VTESQLLEVEREGADPRAGGDRQNRCQLVWQHRHLYKQSREVTGLATDFTDLDRLTSVCRRTTHHHRRAAIDGQNGAGDQHCPNGGHQSPTRCGGFQLGNEQGVLLRRMASRRRHGLTQHSCRRAFWARQNTANCQKVSASWWSRNIFIDDSAAFRWPKCARRRGTETECRRTGPGGVDYLQLMSGIACRREKRARKRTQEVSAISRGLKALAKS